jgi:hypothetical protein
LGFNEAYDLNLIKNLSEDGIYASYMNDDYILADPAVTIGPTVTIPRAILLHQTGLEFQSLRYVEVAWSLLLLGIALFAIRQVMSYFATVVFGILVLTTPFVFSYLSRVEGVFDGIVIALISISLMINALRSDQMNLKLIFLILSGGFLGLAVLAKTIMGLICIAIILYVLVHILTHRKGKHADTLLILIPFVIAVGMAIVWGLIQFAYVSSHLAPNELQDWINLAQVRSQLIFTQIAFTPGSYPQAPDLLHIRMFGPILLALLLVLLLRIFQPKSFGPTREKNANCEFSLLGSIPLIWLSWVFFVSGPEINVSHIVQGIVFAELLIVYTGEILWDHYSLKEPDENHRMETGTRSPSSVVRKPVRLIFVVALIILASIGNSIAFSYSAIAKSSQRLIEQQKVASWVTANIDEESVIYGWGWFVPWDIAFLSSRSIGSVDPTQVVSVESDGWFVVIPEIQVTGNYDLQLTEFLRDNAIPFYAMGDYVIYRLEDVK